LWQKCLLDDFFENVRQFGRVVAKAVELRGDGDSIGSYYFDIILMKTLTLFLGPAEKMGVFVGIGSGYLGM